MRVVIILPFFLIIILSNPPRTIAYDCRCECCTSNNCNPVPIGSHDLWFCSEPTSCSRTDCVNWYPGRCPPEDGSGQTRAICVTNGEHINLPPILFIILGLNLIIFFIQDKF